MRRMVALTVVAVLMASVCQAAARKESPSDRKAAARANWPTKGQVAKAEARAEGRWDKGDAAKTTFRGKTVKFVPADISGFNDEQLREGAMLGILDTETESKDGLPPGRYRVFIRKSGGWEVYFIQNGEPVAKSKQVMGNQESLHEPRFKQGGAAVHYWVLQFDW